MAEFLGDLTVLAALTVLGVGLWRLEQARRDSRGLAAKAGAWVLILGGAGTALCAATYMFAYRSAGDFDRAYPPMMLQAHDMGMMKNMPGGMNMMGNAPSMAPPAVTGEHAEHHPD